MLYFLYLQQLFLAFLSFLLISMSTMHSLFYLITLFIFTSVFLLAGGLEFMALAYLIIYTGAIAVFFLFVIMLVNLRREESVADRIPFEFRLHSIIALHCGLALTLSAFTHSWSSYESLITPFTLNASYYSPGWDGTGLSLLGFVLYTNFQCAIYILAILLLMGLVAATAVARLHFSAFDT